MKNIILKNLTNILIWIYLLLMFIPFSDLWWSIFHIAYSFLKEFSFADYKGITLTLLSISFLMLYVSFIIKIFSKKYFSWEKLYKITSSIILFLLFANFFYFIFLLDAIWAEYYIIFYIIYTLALIINHFYSYLIKKIKWINRVKWIEWITLYTFIAYLVLKWLSTMIWWLSIFSFFLFYIFIILLFIVIIKYILKNNKSDFIKKILEKISKLKDHLWKQD
jgi:hypothetical protein